MGYKPSRELTWVSWVVLWCLRVRWVVTLWWVLAWLVILAVLWVVVVAWVLGLELSSVVGDLENSWASDDVVVSWLVTVLGEDNVGLACLSSGWDGDLVVGARAGDLGWNGTTWEGDEVGVGGGDLLGDSEGEDITDLGDAGWGGGNGWESLKTKTSGAWGVWAASDEESGQRVDLVELERNVEWCWEWRLWRALHVAEVRRVPALDSEDSASSGQVIWRSNVFGSSEVGADTDTLEDVGSSQEALSIGVAEVVGALGNRSGTSSPQTCLQEVDVSLLVLSDLLEVVVEGLSRWHASGLEVGGGELGQSLAVEGVLEVLERQRILEDDGIVNTSWWCSGLALHERSSGSKSCERSGEGGVHLVGWGLV